MKKYFLCIAVAIIVILYVALSIWCRMAVANSDLPYWIKFIILSGKR